MACGWPTEPPDALKIPGRLGLQSNIADRLAGIGGPLPPLENCRDCPGRTRATPRRLPPLPLAGHGSHPHARGMFVVTEEDAAAIRAVFEQEGETELAGQIAALAYDAQRRLG
jgi:hypothetical protein